MRIDIFCYFYFEILNRHAQISPLNAVIAGFHYLFVHSRAVNYVDSDWSIEILGFIIEILEIDVWENFFLPNC